VDAAARLCGLDGVPSGRLFSTRFSCCAADAGEFRTRLGAAPFARYFLNTFVLVTLVLGASSCSARSPPTRSRASSSSARDRLRAGAGAAHDHAGRADRRELPHHEPLGLLDRHDPGDRAALLASAFGIFLLRQTFKTVPKELDDAARVEGASALQVLLKVYVPLARPIYVAYGLVSVSYHWNNFLWPLIVTNSVEARPLTVGLQVFSSGDQGIDWSIICAATLMTSAPLLVGFLLFQRQFVQSFMRAGIR
jgi:sn-glycerol 3-phosphate transport system permease protein